MADRGVEREQRVTALELFFDLVFVFAVTQVTSLLARDHSWGGLLRGLLLLGVLWWVWSGYAWLTNMLDPEEGGVRLTMLAAIAAMLVLSLASPRAFGTDGVLFGSAYLVVRALHMFLLALAGREHHGGPSPVLRVVPATTITPALLIVAGFLHGSARLGVWGAALAVSYLGALLGHMRGWHVSPAHFVERFGLMIIIALGESIVAIGVGARGLPLDAGVITAALLGVTVAACIWWSYFDWLVYVAQAKLAEVSGSARARLARDAFSYLHLPMVTGIVLFSFGLKTTLGDSANALSAVPAFGLFCGIAVYLVAHVALRLRLSGGFGRGRPIAAALLIALSPLGTVVPALAALAMVAAICVALIVYEVLWHREERAVIRSRRTAFSMEDAAGMRRQRPVRRHSRPRTGERPDGTPTNR